MRSLRTLVFFSILVTVGAEEAMAQADSLSGPEAPLEEILDELLPRELDRLGVPGAAIAVVRRDTVLMIRGWGTADIASDRRVEPNTAFRVASVSKLFTATAVLLLHEAGLLDLDADIDKYLPRPFPHEFDGPITLHGLLTHTSGLDLTDIGDATPRAGEVYSLRELVEHHPQPQVMPPGLAHHYSNFGYALAGYVTERVSGTPFAGYVEQAIFQPLGMDGSTFRQPPPAAIAARLATGYVPSGGGVRPVPLDFTHVAPADALITSAADIAPFLQAHLGDGRLLEPGTLRRMHATQFTASPSPYGMGYGFEENVIAGRRVLQHAGVQLGFASFLVIFPEDDLAVFIAQNLREGSLRWSVLEAVAQQLLLDRPSPSPAPSDGRDPGVTTGPGARYAGHYRHTGYPHHTFEKAAWILGFRGSEAVVESAGAPDAVLINGERWERAPAAGPHMFAHPGEPWWIKGFLVDDTGVATYHVAGREVLERMHWWERKRVVQLTLMAATLASFITLLAWLVGALRRRRLPVDLPRGLQRARTIRRLASGAWIAGLAAFFISMPIMMERPIQFDYGPTWELIGVISLLQLAALGAAVIVGIGIAVWIRRWSSLGRRIGLALHALLMGAALFVLGYMNLIGYHF